ncbi:MAG: 1-acyl-sn-glycerol-3-phosphate acyltransferase [Saprospirales bacterium]|nr:1-acyl-sn-glycerol-3-phosphate acyltransferase [Saprospirales bacterium]
MIQFRGFLRFWVFVGVALYYLVPILIRAAFRGDDLPYALRRRRVWAVKCSQLVGVRIDVDEPPVVEGPALYVSNHRSYYDPVAVLRDVEALPVAKAEVSGWPFIGFAARSTGVMWVIRENRESRKQTVEAIEDTLNEGHSVLIYPEGTTHTELKSMPFRQGAFRVAAALGTPVIPIAIEYSRPEDAWIGSSTFIPHFLTVFGRRRIYIKMRYGAPLTDTDPERLLQRTQEWIDAQVREMRKQWFEEEGFWENRY